MKILNLYAGVGGNRRLWTGHNVTAVESDEKVAAVYGKLYPSDTVIVDDAHEYLRANFERFDFIWSSPPCQSHSRFIRSGRNRKPRYPDMRLYEEVLFLSHNFKGLFCVENVVPYYEPFLAPQKLGRHLFWSNFEITQIAVPAFKNMMERQNLGEREKLMDWLDIHFEEKLYMGNNHCSTQVLRNCVHPELGLHILKCATSQV